MKEEANAKKKEKRGGKKVNKEKKEKKKRKRKKGKGRKKKMSSSQRKSNHRAYTKMYTCNYEQTIKKVANYMWILWYERAFFRNLLPIIMTKRSHSNCYKWKKVAKKKQKGKQREREREREREKHGESKNLPFKSLRIAIATRITKVKNAMLTTITTIPCLGL